MKSTDDDIQSRSEGVEIIMAPEYVPLLDEAVMDFVELDDGEQQFVFINPKDANYSPPEDESRRLDRKDLAACPFPMIDRTPLCAAGRGLTRRLLRCCRAACPPRIPRR